MGAKITLDDFGAGYSLLTHMRHLPADTIKINYRFGRNMLTTASDDALSMALLHCLMRSCGK
ncbi:EAL domain-containing protein [Methylicorpusculum oleiharenae]|uniref:EAL domain-containing protein n=1 Tax=Methylicorpusculum oleiharenae TaxID=1338687 RepID=UPI0038B3EB36